MHRIIALSATLIAGALIGAPQTADSAPSFPIVLDGQDCVGAYCYYTTWTLNQDGTFDESYGLDGTWSYNPNFRGTGGLAITYNPNYWPYVYYGQRNGTCLSGPIRDSGGANAGTFDACIVP